MIDVGIYYIPYIRRIWVCFGGQETNAILFDAFDLLRSARPTASTSMDFGVFQCESFDQD